MTETVQVELIGSFAAVLVAIVGLVGVVLQSNRRTRQENSEQHAEGRSIVEGVAAKLDLVHRDVRDTRDDVVEVRERLAQHGERIDRIENGDGRG